MPRDYYETLGVPKDASQDEIKKAFRKKAHELHPDKGGDAEAFKQVNEAYQMLGDEKKRGTYDRFGHAAFQDGAGPSGFGGATGGRDHRGGAGGFGFGGIDVEDLGDLGDVIGSMFGFGAAARSRTRRGRDVETTVNVDFMDAVRGAKRTVQLRVQSSCGRCAGSGAETGSRLTACSACGGAGRITQAQRTPFGTFQSVAVCNQCHGTGKVPEKVCTTCRGTGVTVQNRALDLEIPAGIGDGETIKLAGQGEAAPYGGASGDLYVHMRVASHPKFTREGNNVLSEEAAPFTMFLLGGTVGIETVDGPVELQVPAGTGSGTAFKLRGQGIPFLRSRTRGDHLVALVAEVPKRLTREQKGLVERMRELGL